LRPDEFLLFDNRRVLHGRSATVHAGRRHLKRLKVYLAATAPGRSIDTAFDAARG
jgi:alpha-ketoglutarate-dependent taurine dioxygenase